MPMLQCMYSRSFPQPTNHAYDIFRPDPETKRKAIEDATNLLITTVIPEAIKELEGKFNKPDVTQEGTREKDKRNSAPYWPMIMRVGGDKQNIFI